MEASLLERGVPSHVTGSMDLWQRMEVKDAMALLRLVAHPADNMALSRVMDLPVCKGLGGCLGLVAEHLHARCSASLMHTWLWHVYFITRY